MWLSTVVACMCIRIRMHMHVPSHAHTHILLTTLDTEACIHLFIYKHSTHRTCTRIHNTVIRLQKFYYQLPRRWKVKWKLYKVDMGEQAHIGTGHRRCCTHRYKHAPSLSLSLWTHIRVTSGARTHTTTPTKPYTRASSHTYTGQRTIHQEIQMYTLARACCHPSSSCPIR